MLHRRQMGRRRCCRSTSPIRRPATSSRRCPSSARAETRAAIEAAAKAQKAWGAKPAKERAAILRKWFNLMMENQEDLAQIMTAEQGKPLAESRGEVAYGAVLRRILRRGGQAHLWRDHPLALADVAHRRHPPAGRRRGRHHAVELPQCHDHPQGGPGACRGLLPSCASRRARRRCRLWPCASLPSAPAFRPASSTSSPARPRQIGGELTSNPLVRIVTFTGSTEIGKLLMQQCASTVKKVGLELGGNAPFIVFDDADLDAAVAGAMASKYRNAGQTCVCANRILVQDRRLRHIRRQTRRSREEAESRQRRRAGRHHRPADQCRGGEEGRASISTMRSRRAPRS